MKECEEYFVPLNVKKEFWTKGLPFIFLDSYFQNQFSDLELKNIEYQTLEPFDFRYTRDEIDFFESQIIHFFQQELNSFHNVDFDFVYWRKIFAPYLKKSILNIISKAEELQKIVKLFPNSHFSTFSYTKELEKKYYMEFGGINSNEEYNNFIFCKIAKDFFNFKVFYGTETTKKYEQGVFKEEIKDNQFFSKLKKITLKKIISKLKCTISDIQKSFFSPQLLLWCTYFDENAMQYFQRKSFGKIRCLCMNHVETDNSVNTLFRKQLKERMISYFADCKFPMEKQIVLMLLPDMLPFFYVENFKKYLEASERFIEKHKSVRLFFATCTYCRETEPFLLTYAQKQSKTILSEMHGGDYGIVNGRYNLETFLNDKFYTWGTWAKNIYDTDCVLSAAPSYRNHLLYDGKARKEDYILFLGSHYVYYIDSVEPYFFGHQGFHNSMNAVIDFFAHLASSVTSKMLVRNYYVDFGYHFNDIFHSKFPQVRLQGFSQKDADENFDPIARNDSFANTLLNCSLILVNEFETCFIEALYAEKPFILLFNKYGFSLRIEEIPYFKMMEDAGLLFYDWNDAAVLLNKIYSNISDWWFEPERQKVVKIIRERYSMKVDNPKEWWYKEFMRQIKISRKELKRKKKNER